MSKPLLTDNPYPFGGSFIGLIDYSNAAQEILDAHYSWKRKIRKALREDTHWRANFGRLFGDSYKDAGTK